MFKQKLLSLFVALFATTTLWAQNNVITYTASTKLTEATSSYGFGLRTNAFNTKIYSHTFSNGTGTITFEGDVTTIGNYAFWDCDGLTSVTIPNSVTTIGNSAFRGCSGLTSVTIPKSVLEISDYAFQDCDQLTMIDIPNNVSKLSLRAFDNCKSLKYIHVDADNAKYCSTDNVVFNITRDTLLFYPAGKEDTNYFVPEGVVNIGEWAFATSRFLKNIQLPHSLKSISDDAFRDCDSLLSITIPSNVKKIGWFAFSGCNSLQNVIIEDGVEFIDDDAFYICNKLSSINIPASVTYIGSTAFYRAHGLTNIQVDEANTHYRSVNGVLFTHNLDTLIQYPLGKTQTSYKIPDEVSYIDKNAFEACEYLQSVELGSSVTAIGQYAFAYCEKMVSVKLSQKVRIIDTQAFYSCKSLTSLIIPNIVTHIGSAVFSCSKLATLTCEAVTPPICSGNLGVSSSLVLYVPKNSVNQYKIATYWNVITDIRPIVCVVDSGECGDNLLWELSCDSVLTIKGIGSMYDYGRDKYPWNDYMMAIKEVVLSEGITSIGSHAFFECKNLVTIDLPKSLTMIGNFAFYNCYNLQSLFIPNQVNSIGEYAFWYCYGLKQISVDGLNTQYDSRENCNAIIETSTNKLILGCENSFIPSSVTIIGDRAFHYCLTLKAIDIPNNVTFIGENAFWCCKNVQSVLIPNSVQRIGESAFQLCSSMTNLQIGENITAIESEGFFQCSALRTITINALTPPILGKDVFDRCEIDSITLYVPAQSVVAYKEAEGWKDFIKIQPIGVAPNNVITYTASSQLSGYNGSLSVGATTFGPAITSHTFSNGTGTIICSGEVTTIGDYAFSSCSDLASVTIGDAVTTIGSYAFYGCSGLTSINVDAVNTHYVSVDGVLFNYAKDTLIRYPMGNTRTTYTIPNSVTTIGEDAFDGCSGLTSVTIPNSVTMIGDYAFYGCSGLTSITIPNSVKTIGRYAFGACFSLTSVTIPDSVTLLEEFAFNQCSNLTSITIGKSIPSIEQNTFDCRNLASITCYATTPPACLKNSLNYINKSIPIFVPAGSIVTYKQAEGWKEFTNIIGICEGDPYFSVQDTIICGRPYPFVWEGDTVRYGGEVWHWGNSWSWYNHVDTVTRNYISVGGCDSILQLVVYYPGYQYELINDTIEEGQFHWSEYTETGIYYKRYPNVYGCDSTVLELHLYVMPKPIYMVTISVNNAKYGSVEGAGTYNKGDTVLLSAIPNKGYQFNQWSDGVTTNPRTIYNIDKDYTLTAQFGIKQCSWLVESSDLEMGAVYTDFTNEYYNYGTQITVEASANSGYKFVKWNDGKKYNPYKFSILEDKYLLAIFIAEEEEVDTTQVQPSDTTATFTWPFIVGGFTYTLTIYLDAACTIPFCTLTFNQYGQLTGITFGSRVPRRSAMANQEEEFTTTIKGLSAGTEYFYKMETKDEEGKLLNTDEGGFSTQNSDVITNTDKVEMSIHRGKFIKYNQLYIFRGDKIYNAAGQKVK